MNVKKMWVGPGLVALALSVAGVAACDLGKPTAPGQVIVTPTLRQSPSPWIGVPTPSVRVSPSTWLGSPSPSLRMPK